MFRFVSTTLAFSLSLLCSLLFTPRADLYTMAQPPLFDQILNKIHRLKGQADQHGVDADASARWEREMRDLFSSTWPPEICNAPNCPPALTYLQYKLYRIAVSGL